MANKEFLLYCRQLKLIVFFFFLIIMGVKSQDKVIVGSVNGEGITQDAMTKWIERYDNLDVLDAVKKADSWDQIISRMLIKQQSNIIGLEVTEAEKDALLSGEFHSAIVYNNFSDLKTGQIDYYSIEQLCQYYKDLNYEHYDDEERLSLKKNKASLDQFVIDVKEDQLMVKYFNLLGKGIYMPKSITKSQEKLSLFELDYVHIPYKSIVAKKLPIREKEIDKEISRNAASYNLPTRANIDYIKLPVHPSKDDSLKVKEELNKLVEDFKKVDNDTLFLLENEVEVGTKFFTATKLSEPQDIQKKLLNAEIGTVVGPYLVGNSYRVSKILENKIIPDSVRSRHILIGLEERGAQEAYDFADSLRNEIQKGTLSFEEAALRHSRDGSRAIGGDLGFHADDDSFVPAFEDYLFGTHEKDALGIIYTQFGVHLIQITDYKYSRKGRGIRVASISRPINSSKKTVAKVLKKAEDFVRKNRSINKYRAAATAMGLEVKSAYHLEVGGYEIVGLGKNTTSVEIIKWAHTTAKKEVVASKVYSILDEESGQPEAYVVPVLRNIKKAGTLPLEDKIIRAEAKAFLEKVVKKEALVSSVEHLTSLDEIATHYGLTVKKVFDFGQYYPNIRGQGWEPILAVVAECLNVSELSKPILGQNGIFFIKVISKKQNENLSEKNKRIEEVLMMSFRVKHLHELKEKADIIDNRLEID